MTTKARGKRQENSDELRRAMAEALVELMREKPLGKITAQEIADRAGTGRVTWFRLLHSKEHAVTWLVKRMWAEHLEKNGFAEVSPTDQENGRLFFHFNYENRELLKLICENGLRYSLYEAWYGLLLPEPTGDVLAGYVANTTAYGMVGLLDHWIKRDFQETPEQLIAFVESRG